MRTENGRPADQSGSARWLLAIDTSTERAGIALTNGETAASLAWNARRSQTTSLTAALHELLTLADVPLSDVGAVGVAIGPGTFNGLRVGIATAKGLVLARNLPIIGVGTLDATAYPFLLNRQPVVAVAAAGRGRLVSATYLPTTAGSSAGPGTDPMANWRIEGPANERMTELAERLDALPEQSWLVGELTSEQIGALGHVIQARRLIVPSGPLRERTPVAVASLAWERWQLGCVGDPASLAPVYLHSQSPSSPKRS